ncbi:MAG: hypothetical protein HQ488_04590 [Parcubacteria group bacterium]|nr:hypothetical protein [Parcubacteria group bacterium]
MTNQVPKLWIFFFIIIAGLIVGFALSSPAVQEQEEVVDFQENVEMTGVREQTFGAMLDGGGNAIYLENQLSGTTGVQVGFAVLARPGFVVIFDDDDGVPGKVIGASDYLQNGGEHLTVALQTFLIDGAVYYAVLYHDNGDLVFDENADSQALDSTDSVVLMTFLSTYEAQPEVGAITP